MTNVFPRALYVCTECGFIKNVITNTNQQHIYEQCTDDCSWSGLGKQGPMILSKNGMRTGYHKRLFVLLKGE